MTEDPNNTWTSDALMRGDTDAIRKRVLDDPNYIHERDYIGNTPLLNAIDSGELELVKFLLEHSADPNVKVDDGYTCLLSAIESEEEPSTTIVDQLIRAGADIHQTGTNGWTPLHMAAARGYVEKARLLIAAGAEVNRRTEIDGNETPLMEAAFTGQADTVRLLLQHGADPTMRDVMNNRTPLEIAQETAKGPDNDVIEHLKEDDLMADADKYLDDMLKDMDLSAEELASLKQITKDLDMTQSYIDSSNDLVKNGKHTEVIRILTEHQS